MFGAFSISNMGGKKVSFLVGRKFSRKKRPEEDEEVEEEDPYNGNDSEDDPITFTKHQQMIADRWVRFMF